jgi:glycosyltransferase involved in cell wall biosynthesis
MAEAFSTCVSRVSLFYIPADGWDRSVSDYYQITEPVELRRLRRAVLPWSKRFTPSGARRLPKFAHAYLWSLYVATSASRERPGLVYVREPVLGLAAAQLGLPTVLELHGIPDSASVGLYTRACRHPSIRLVVGITRKLVDDLVAMGICDRDKALVAHDAVRLEEFSVERPRESLRRSFGADIDRPLVVYAGSFYENRGARLLFETAKLAPEAEFLLVGATESQRAELEELRKANNADNLRVALRIAPARIPELLAAADLLIAPETGDEQRSRHASPLKIFEYMAAGRPIVAGDTPAVREILSDGVTARLVPTGQPAAMAAAVSALIRDPDQRAQLGANARRAVEPWSWNKRAIAILDAFERAPRA